MPNSTTPEDAVRIRRHQPTRMESFVDASFAFAITLVVVAVGHVPASVPEMLRALHGLPTFAVCFLLLAGIWLAHRSWSRCYDIEDAVSVRLSLILVFVVLIFVYPMRMLFAQALLAWSGGWLTDGSVAPMATTTELRTAYAVFGIAYAAIATIFVLLYTHSLHCAERIALDAAERLFTRRRREEWFGQLATCIVSVALAHALPMRDLWSCSAPGFAYALIGLGGAVAGRRCRRELARLSAPSA